MKILAHKNVNLQTKTTGTGLVSLRSGKTHIVPDDVAEFPAFNMLKKDGYITVQEDVEESEEHPLIKEARISGSPMHLVAAKIAQEEADKLQAEADAAKIAQEEADKPEDKDEEEPEEKPKEE